MISSPIRTVLNSTSLFFFIIRSITVYLAMYLHWFPADKLTKRYQALAVDSCPILTSPLVPPCCCFLDTQ